MLEHEPSQTQTARGVAANVPAAEQSTASPAPAAEQVTAEEFAAAAAAVDARRAEAARRADKTVPIGQAIDELNVNASPDEIWQEVQARRAAPKSVPMATGAAIKAAALLKKAGQTATPLLAKSISDWQAQVSDYKSEAQSIKELEAHLHERKSALHKRRWPVVAALIAAACLLPNVFGGHHGGSRDRDIDTPSVSSSQTVTLAEVKEGEPFSVNQDVLEKIEKGADAAQTLVQAHGDVDNGWTLVKHNGHVYVRGYTLPLSDKALQVGQVNVYNADDAGVLDDGGSQKVTLRLDTLHVDKNKGGDTPEMDVSKVHPDAFTHEDW